MSDKPNNMVNITINGQNYEVEAGINVIKACRRNGIDVPHYCYHSDLSIAGNCRMCLVKIEKIPKLAIACATQVNDGMVIDTEAPEVQKARESVMEFLLINHPLDCPVCDQAGECKLQDYSYTYGKSLGRFSDEKVVKAVRDFGEHVKYWGTRCILCTRCVRFTYEISGTKELAVFNRGDHAEINIFPGESLDNPLSMNVVDICPVGALVSADFLYKARPWFMERKNSICPECSVGCNTRIDSLDNNIKRIKSRKNRYVNKSFMCDHGRLSFDYINSKTRLEYPMSNASVISWKEGMDLFKKKIQDSGNNNQYNKLAFLVSSWTSNEALYLVKKLTEENLPGSDVYFFSRAKEDDRNFPGFRISGDRNPNTHGIISLFKLNSPGDKSVKELIDKINSKSIDSLVVLGGIPGGSIPGELVGVKDKLKDIIIIDHSKSELSDKASLVLPGLSFAEKSGSYINDQNRVQRVLPAINPVTGGKSEDQILQELRLELQGSGRALSTSAVFEEMSSMPGFNGMNYRTLADIGTVISS